MPPTGPPTIETARLRLRPLVIADTMSLNRIQSDPEHMRFYPHPFSLQESRQWIERMHERYARDGFALLAVEDRSTEEFLGNVGPLVQTVDRKEEIELGWSITPTRSRQGIATEAALASREWVFAELLVDYVISLILPDNAPSRGVAERLGMTVWKEVLWGKDRPRTHLVYRSDRSRPPDG
ncbi:MAG TPA: GNAT family N-acetyltransferase [Candidatus Limnocylindria bacterium]|nr:GNAT family N-acetyltransferase [Candidatus Limnocylindria bacterium]